ncbi:hypothetical protein BV22DRAFT_1028659 [Leucogyrophana mollusca]|uniref:Uncharacterized protein n=1 Tax=Leucogyrophana mollusca TaxID=85980 RepID=A0ACB8BW23_9AGAM|nr:hypothetical protein BV22DRAFT_1028659 [Leucogyrophana mollusca]
MLSILNNFGYTPLAQELGAEENVKEDDTAFSNTLEVRPRGGFADLYSSPTFLAVVLFALLAINALCFATTIRQMNQVTKALQPHLDFIETRNLPRPDQYNGL